MRVLPQYWLMASRPTGGPHSFRSVSLFDLSREGLRPTSGPKELEPGPMEGENGAVGIPRSGLRGGMYDFEVLSRSP